MGCCVPNGQQGGGGLSRTPHVTHHGFGDFGGHGNSGFFGGGNDCSGGTADCGAGAGDCGAGCDGGCWNDINDNAFSFLFVKFIILIGRC